MTEEEWTASANSEPMLRFLGERGRSARQRRLLDCACGRHLESWSPHTDINQALAYAERYADGELSDSTLRKWCHRACDVCNFIYRQDNCDPKQWMAAHVISLACSDKPSAFVEVSSWTEIDCQDSGFGPQADLFPEDFLQHSQQLAAAAVRYIFGNPFRELTWHSCWQTSATISLAHVIYTDRSFERMPQLAITLEEAGCANTEVLRHCRESAPHFRGCWLLDLLLGKR